MTKYLITPSLLNSYQYYINDEFKSPADSRADFLKTLSKEKFVPNKAMQKGIDFEDSIKNIADKFEELKIKDYEAKSNLFKIAEIVKGGLWQQTCKKDLHIGNKEFLLYGKMDVVKRDTVYDIKFTSNYELGKFLDSAQHLIYLYCTGLPKFQYLVSDGEDFWIEDYFNDGNVENRIKSMISDFLGYLENDKEAKEMFETKWGAKYE
jgi:hypothetical protein